MYYEFDPAKDEINLDKHGVSLLDTDGFEWETAVVREDSRKQYPEQPRNGNQPQRTQRKNKGLRTFKDSPFG